MSFVKEVSKWILSGINGVIQAVDDDEIEDEASDSSRDRKEKRTYQMPKEVKLARVVVDDEEVIEGQVWIEFYPNGSCSGGDVFLMDSKERTYRVALQFLTGSVKIMEVEET